MKIKKQKQGGFVALLTIIIVSAMALIIAFSSSVLGLGELDLGFMESRAQEALSIADGCMEEALGRLRIDNTYSGASLSLGDGSCIISVVTAGGMSTTTVTAQTTDSFYKKIESVAEIVNGVVTVHSWEERTD